MDSPHSVNWIIGCPLDCGYCVRHLFGNFEMKLPRALMSDAGIDHDTIEPVDSTIAAISLRTAFTHAQSYRVVLY